jgi:hypothetical protein
MLRFIPSRRVRRTQVENYHRVRNGIETKDLHKLIMNRVSWKPLPVDTETNRALIHCAAPWALKLISICYTKKSLLLNHKTRYEDFVLWKYVHGVWAIRGYYWIRSPVDNESDANESWNTLSTRQKELLSFFTNEFHGLNMRHFLNDQSLCWIHKHE